MCQQAAHGLPAEGAGPCAGSNVEALKQHQEWRSEADAGVVPDCRAMLLHPLTPAPAHPELDPALDWLDAPSPLCFSSLLGMGL